MKEKQEVENEDNKRSDVGDGYNLHWQKQSISTKHFNKTFQQSLTKTVEQNSSPPTFFQFHHRATHVDGQSIHSSNFLQYHLKIRMKTKKVPRKKVKKIVSHQSSSMYIQPNKSIGKTDETNTEIPPTKMYGAFAAFSSKNPVARKRISTSLKGAGKISNNSSIFFNKAVSPPPLSPPPPPPPFSNTMMVSNNAVWREEKKREQKTENIRKKDQNEMLVELTNITKSKHHNHRHKTSLTEAVDKYPISAFGCMRNMGGLSRGNFSKMYSSNVL